LAAKTHEGQEAVVMVAVPPVNSGAQAQAPHSARWSLYHASRRRRSTAAPGTAETRATGVAK